MLVESLDILVFLIYFIFGFHFCGKLLKEVFWEKARSKIEKTKPYLCDEINQFGRKRQQRAKKNEMQQTKQFFISELMKNVLSNLSIEFIFQFLKQNCVLAKVFVELLFILHYFKLSSHSFEQYLNKIPLYLLHISWLCLL